MSRSLHRTALGAFAADLAVALACWRRLPARVPVHWNLHGDVDRWGSRWELLAFGPPLLLLLWALFAVLPRIDPKVRAAAAARDPDAPPAEEGSRDAVFAIALVLLAAFHVVTLLQAAGLAPAGVRAPALLLSGLMLLLGNVLGRVRPNFFVGVRTPWTLADDEVWRRTHRLAARTFFGGGVLGLAACAVLPAQGALVALVALMLGASAWPVAASYVYWRRGR